MAAGTGPTFKCEGVTENLYKTLKKNEKELWFCEWCKCIVKGSIPKLEQLEEKLKKKKRRS